MTLDVGIRSPRCPRSRLFAPGLAPPRWCPAALGEALDAVAADENALRPQQFPLQLRAAAKTPQLSSCGDDPVAWDPWRAAVPHDVSDCAERPRVPSRRGDVAICCHASRRD